LQSEIEAPEDANGLRANVRDGYFVRQSEKLAVMS